MMTASKSQFQRAIDKAEAEQSWRNLNRVGPNCWEYLGINAYILTLRGEEITCSCAAGQRELPCYHAAGLWLQRKGEQAVRRQAQREVAAVASPASRTLPAICECGHDMMAHQTIGYRPCYGCGCPQFTERPSRPSPASPASAILRASTDGALRHQMWDDADEAPAFGGLGA